MCPSLSIIPVIALIISLLICIAARSVLVSLLIPLVDRAASSLVENTKV